MRKTYSSERYEDLYSDDLYNVDGERELRESIARFVTTYCAKENFAGKMLEVDGYALWNTRAQVIDANKAKRAQSPVVIQNRNHQRAERRIVQLVNENFKSGDLEAYLSFEKEPENRKEGFAAFNWMVCELRKLYRSMSAELFYLYIDEAEGRDGEPLRFHYHIFMNLTNGITRDMVEDLWRSKYGIANGTILRENEYGLTGFAKYVLKAPAAVKNRRKWNCSRNMRKPLEHRSTRLPNKKGITRKLLTDILENRVDAREFFEKAYPNYRFLDLRAKTSEHVGGVYIYVRMRLKCESDNRTPSAHDARIAHAHQYKTRSKSRLQNASAGGIPDTETGQSDKKKRRKHE